MLCEKCGKYSATTYLKQTIKGRTVGMNVCSHCAMELGLGSMLSTFGLNMDDIFSSFLNKASARTADRQKLCPKCGKSLHEIATSGRVGCDLCYTTFRTELLTSIEKIHGHVRHAGKVSASAGEEIKVKRQLAQLKESMNHAIAVFAGCHP